MRCALIGYGLAGRAFHAPFLTATAGLALDVVVTGNPDRARQAAADHPGAAIVATVADVWERDPRLVVVASPNATHVALATEAIDRGVPVVVDKPLALTAGDARGLAERARAAGVLLIPFHNRRWDDDFLTLRRLLADRALGSVHRFESRFERWRPDVAKVWREEPGATVGGGVLLDLGPHLVDQALKLFGPVADVHAEVDVRRQGARVVDDAFLALHHASGVRSHLWMSATAADQGPKMRVLGSDGAFVVHGLDPQEAALREGRRYEGPARQGELVTREGRVQIELDRGDYGAFYAGVERALRGAAEAPVAVEDAVAGLEVLEAVAHTSGEVRVPGDADR